MQSYLLININILFLLNKLPVTSRANELVERIEQLVPFLRLPKGTRIINRGKRARVLFQGQLRLAILFLDCLGRPLVG